VGPDVGSSNVVIPPDAIVVRWTEGTGFRPAPSVLWLIELSARYSDRDLKQPSPSKSGLSRSFSVTPLAPVGHARRLPVLSSEVNSLAMIIPRITLGTPVR
jgi:hypothetical protein